MMASVSAITVDPGQTIELPQLESFLIRSDHIGVDRTYLYCTWHIDGIVQEAVLMSENTCPETPRNFTFDEDQEYLIRVDSAQISWNSITRQWEVVNTQHVDTARFNYDLDLPEPSQTFLNSIIDIIIGPIRNALCQVFPWLGFCSP